MSADHRCTGEINTEVIAIKKKFDAICIKSHVVILRIPIDFKKKSFASGLQVALMDSIVGIESIVESLDINVGFVCYAIMTAIRCNVSLLF